MSHIFGQEGPNSLLSFLIKEGLALGLSAGAYNRLQGSMGLFEVSIDLTEKGEIDYKNVIDYVYKFINQIKLEGPQDYVYKDL